MAEGGSPKIVRFGPFEVDIDQGSLRKNGLKVKVQPKPFQILVLLLEHSGEVVTREELRSKLWPEGTYVDFEHGLNTAVKKLRKTLEDDPNRPIFLETIPRQGYRFLVPILVGRSEPELEPARSPQLPLERGHISQRRRLGVMSMFVLFVFVVAGAVKLSSLSTLRVGSTRAPLLVLPLTTLPGVEDYPAFSSDGSQVAYSWVGPEASSPGIYVKLIGPGTTLQITRSGLGADVYPALVSRW